MPSRRSGSTSNSSPTSARYVEGREALAAGTMTMPVDMRRPVRQLAADAMPVGAAGEWNDRAHDSHRATGWQPRPTESSRAGSLRGPAAPMSPSRPHAPAEEAGAEEARLPIGWYARVVRRLCPNGGRVLNFGCGDGALLKRLSADFETYGYDAVPLARSRCRTNVPDAVILESWEAQPAASFDLIVSVHGMERLAQPLRTVKQMGDKLAAEGILLFAVPNPGGLGRHLKGLQWFA